MRSRGAPSLVRASATLAAALALIVSGCPSRAPLQPEARWRAPRQGAVASEHPLATEVGLSILDRGGTAADAAVATALALAVVFPQAGNLGGGGFALWVPHVGEARAFDFRETAPAAADAALYLDGEGRPLGSRSTRGPFAVGVPGSPRGLHELWKNCGSRRLNFSDLVAPAIRLARDGFTVDAWLARDLAVEETRAKMNAFARQVFYPGDRPLREGERLRQPDLASTLELLALEGPDALYNGRIAEAIVAELAAAAIPPDAAGAAPPRPEWMTLADLARYRVQEREPLHGWFRGMEIVTMPPPSSGGIVLLQALGILEGLPLDAEKNRSALANAIERDKGGPAGVDTPFLDERMAHWWIEAARCAFADRAQHMGDPEYHEVPTQELLAPEWIARRRVSIGESADPSVPAWQPPPESTETTHLSVLDKAGNAVSLTTTINSYFGSGILVRGAGFFLNDEMDDFALRAGTPNQFGLVGGAANRLEPGKRPLSSMTPTVVRDGGHANVMVLGSPGGPRIITAVLQVLLRVLVLEQTMEEAVAAPRLHQQWSPATTEFEAAFDPGIVAALSSRRGHAVEVKAGTFGSVQAIWLRSVGGVPVGVSDPRRGGAAAVQSEKGRRSKPPPGPEGE